MRFKGDIIITDPCYIIKSPEDYAKELGIPFPAYPKYTEDIKAYDKAMSEYRSFTNKYDDWGKCDYGDNMEVLGFSNYISEPTIYGDWSCTTWSTPRKDVAAQLEELCELQRKQYELRKQYGEDFDGEVEYYIDDAEGEAHIIGTGNVNFFTTQTGF